MHGLCCSCRMMTVYLELRHPRRIPISAFEKVRHFLMPSGLCEIHSRIRGVCVRAESHSGVCAVHCMQYWVDESHQHVVLYKAQTYYTIPLWQPEPKLSPGQHAGSQMLGESFQSVEGSHLVSRLLCKWQLSIMKILARSVSLLDFHWTSIFSHCRDQVLLLRYVIE